MKNTFYTIDSINDEKGFALVSTLLILVACTVIGIAATNTTNFELKIAGNEKVAAQRFYTADSGWKQSGPYLNAKATAPIIKNLNLKSSHTSYYDIDTSEPNYYQIVRNFGDDKDPIEKDPMNPPNTEYPSEFPSDGSISNMPYWYRVIYQDDSQAIAFGANYRDFQYDVDCNADLNAEVNAGVRKVYRVGY